jgi:3-oxoacyl-(acyl-carrier-protein) synthase
MGKNKQVVITGMATINPLGDNLEEYYDNLIQGKSGIKRWSTIDVGNLECRIGGDIGDYDVKGALESIKEKIDESLFKTLRKLFRSSTFSSKTNMLCSLQAYIDAGLYGSGIDPFRVSIVTGGHNFNSNYVIRNSNQFNEEPEFIEPLLAVEALDPNLPASVSEILGIQGPTSTVGGACASGNLALREGFRDILMGECDVSVVTGAAFDISPLDMQAMIFLNAIPVINEFQDAPHKASRPYDVNRAGFIPSHGCGAIILEDLDYARKRNASIYAELINVRANSSSCHLPSPSADSQARLIKDLLTTAGVNPSEVDYVNCHATSTPLGDLEEIKAIKEVFGKHAYNLKLNAPKSMLGHTCWAAPIVETIGGVLQMSHGTLHPSINIEQLDPEVDLDVCANEAQDHQIKVMLKNSFGFGGINCCSLIKKYEE